VGLVLGAAVGPAVGFRVGSAVVGEADGKGVGGPCVGLMIFMGGFFLALSTVSQNLWLMLSSAVASAAKFLMVMAGDVTQLCTWVGLIAPPINTIMIWYPSALAFLKAASDA
jgi:hypothetical protein